MRDKFAVSDVELSVLKVVYQGHLYSRHYTRFGISNRVYERFALHARLSGKILYVLKELKRRGFLVVIDQVRFKRHRFVSVWGLGPCADVLIERGDLS